MTKSYLGCIEFRHRRRLGDGSYAEISIPVEQFLDNRKNPARDQIREIIEDTRNANKLNKYMGKYIIGRFDRGKILLTKQDYESLHTSLEACGLRKTAYDMPQKGRVIVENWDGGEDKISVESLEEKVSQSIRKMTEAEDETASYDGLVTEEHEQELVRAIGTEYDDEPEELRF